MSISYTNSPTTKIVKPTQTLFTNNTDKPITLNFNEGSTSIGVGEQSQKISKEIVSIKYNAEGYYSAQPNNYIIPANKTATLTKSGTNIIMNIT